ncbi:MULTISPECIES: DoxX family protein [Bacteroidota]|nr:MULTISPECIES: MauE/DoxX family redox-associated membrane protein [Bacteroidota]QRQ63228.1 DoxX family protein [Sphingobacterium multivorum]SPZ95068.1 Uncharacterised protein [Sphingobacterium multivorum]
MIVVRFIRTHFVTIVSILLALLFVYAAGSKLLDFENFQVQLAQSPLLSAYSGIISYGVIAIEIFVAILLCIDSTRVFGLYASLGLLAAFTIYIFLILKFSDFVPCSCGGILEKLGWEEHLLFNIFFFLITGTGIFVLSRKGGGKTLKTLLLSGTTTIISCLIVILMFLSSENIIKKENNFTRRFLQHPIFENGVLDLGVNSYYFAGMADGNIYLGNVTAPLFISKIDSGLQSFTRIKIKLDNTDHAFKSLQLKIKSPYFYLYDGNVPVIYRGKLGDSVAHTISYGDAFFNQLTVLDSAKFGVRTQRKLDNQYTIASLDLNREPKAELKNEVLQKQIDGVFDVDGLLISDPESGNMVYTYFYRNQFIVLDSKFNIKNRFNTIDTTRTANISVTRLSDGRTKMNAPPFSVNRGFALFGNLIFNRSNLKGKYEPSSTWRNSSIIDVYRTDEQRYIGSFYIRNKNGKGMSSLVSDGRNIYALVDNEIQRYKIREGAFK